MSRKSRFLEVEHEVIVEEDPPYFLGDELHASVKVRNLKAEPVEKKFCYILQFPGGMEPRTMKFDLGPNEEQDHPLYDNRPPYYLRFMGNFQIILLKGEAGRRLNKVIKLRIPSPPRYDALYAGNVRDKDSYELQARTTEATDTMAKTNRRMLYLTIAIVVLAGTEIGTEILTLILG